MQNKPNFPKPKMTVTLVKTMTNNNEQRTMNHPKQTQSNPNKLEAKRVEGPALRSDSEEGSFPPVVAMSFPPGVAMSFPHVVSGNPFW
jgi:hypothetical protein